MPVVNGTRASPASASVRSRTAGSLSGEPKWGPPRRERRSEVRQQPGLVEHSLGGAAEILDRRRATQRPQLLARGAVAKLRLIAQREQRFATAGGGAGARQLEHLVQRHVGALAAPRRTRERAVVADVAAELGQRDEQLWRERDQALAAQPARLRQQLVGRGREQLVRLCRQLRLRVGAVVHGPHDTRPKLRAHRRSGAVREVGSIRRRWPAAGQERPELAGTREQPPVLAPDGALFAEVAVA
jgi:hypothetical protein